MNHSRDKKEKLYKSYISGEDNHIGTWSLVAYLTRLFVDFA